MSIEHTITGLKQSIAEREEELVTMKKTVNMLAKQLGQGAVYGGEELVVGTSESSQIRSDSFYGQPLNSSIRQILEMRKAAGKGPLKVRDIYKALQDGGYEFEAKNDENAIRGLRISLGKSTHTFHKLPNGEYGLVDWYPKVKGSRAGGKPAEHEEEASDDDASEVKEGGDA